MDYGINCQLPLIGLHKRIVALRGDQLLQSHIHIYSVEWCLLYHGVPQRGSRELDDDISSIITCV